MLFAPVSARSVYLAITTSNQAVAGLTMKEGELYRITVTVPTAVAQGAAPTAALASGSVLVTPEESLVIDGKDGAALAAIGTAAGHMTVVPLRKLFV